jgi:ketosteroid isomerase-like protein
MAPGRDRNLTAAQREHVAMVQRAFQLWVGRDIEGVLEMYAPDVVVNAPHSTDAGPLHGHEGFMDWMSRWNAEWGSFDFDVQAIDAVGERHVAATVMVIGEGRESGAPVKRLTCWVFEIRDRRVVYVEVVGSPERALGIAREREGPAT